MLLRALEALTEKNAKRTLCGYVVFHGAVGGTLEIRDRTDPIGLTRSRSPQMGFGASFSVRASAI
jgi:hypothetical protein